RPPRSPRFPYTTLFRSKLDAPVPKYVSGVADLSDITLLDLCNGTSGVGSSEAAAKPYWLNTPGREWAPLQLASFGLGVQRGPARSEEHTSELQSRATLV